MKSNVKSNILIIVLVCVIIAVSVTIGIILVNGNNQDPKEITYKVTVTCDEKYGTVKGGGQYTEKSKVTVEATGKENGSDKFVVYAWKIDNKIVSVDSKYVFEMAKGDVTITAEFARKFPAANFPTVIINNLEKITDIESIGDVKTLAKMVDGITIGQLILGNKKLPLSVTETAQFKLAYNISLSKILEGDETAKKQLTQETPIGVYADMFFANAMYKTEKLNLVIKNLYELTIADVQGAGTIGGSTKLIAALGMLKFKDIFDSYVQNPATINFLKVYETLQDIAIIDVLTNSVKEPEKAAMNGLKIKDVFDFYYTMIGEPIPTTEIYKNLMKNIGNKTVGEIFGDGSMTIEKLKELLGKLEGITDKTIGELIESSIEIPQSIKDKEWYKKIANKKLMDVLNEILNGLKKTVKP
ncbi:MAG: hypothetical protein RR307_04805 [Clostridia bacterium]